MSLCLDHVERGLQGLRTRRAIRRLEKLPRQPAFKALGADRPGFPVPVDVEIGEGRAIGRMEQLGGLGKIDQDVGPGG
jgi:hypothetical protein